MQREDGSILRFQSSLPRGERPGERCTCHSTHEFQSSLPRGERLFPHPIFREFRRFQSSLPRGERHKSQRWSYRNVGYFNPRSREGSDDHGYGADEPQAWISILAPARGATRTQSNTRISRPLFQSSLPRGERQRNRIMHADRQRISILAPARGATIAQIRTLTMQLSFQSSLPRGERLHTASAPKHSGAISILAPARGATFVQRLRFSER